MRGINRASRVLANPGKSLNLKKTFPGLESLSYLFSSFSTKNVYIVIVHSVIMLNNNSSVQRLFSSSVLKFLLKMSFETSGKVLEFHFQLKMRTMN